MIRIVYDNETQEGDLIRKLLNGNERNFQDDDDTALETAVTISLFTEARADENEIDSLSDISVGEYRGGWWADSFSDQNWGSKLWTLKRQVLSNTTLQRARRYAIEALNWMIDDNVASTIDVTATRQGELLCLQVDITRPGSDSLFSRLWEVRLNAL